jgi:ribonuclease BN (tRNA processing enzyme)
LVLVEILFLGTGGGRVVLATQARFTGGFLIKSKSHQIHVDPGPGALLRMKMLGEEARKTDMVCLSHNHTDHVGDLRGISEALNKAKLIAVKECLRGEQPIMGKAYKRFFERIYEISENQELALDDLKIRTTKTKHNADCVGFIFEIDNRIIGYTSDTGYFKSLPRQFEGVEVLIINVLRPDNELLGNHLATDEVIKILNGMKKKPRAVIITHFGMKMLRAGPLNQARKISIGTGLFCRAADDGTRMIVEDVLQQTSLLGGKYKT